MSPIPLGILAVSGSMPPTAFELISTTILSADTTSVTFSSVPNTYKHLQIRAVTKDSRIQASGANLNINFNGITTTSYAFHSLRGTGSATSSSGSSAQTSIDAVMLGSQGSGNVFTPMIIDILDYGSTTKNKTVKILGGHISGNTAIRLTSGLFISTSDITTIRLGTNLSGFLAGSRFSLYGIKG